MNEFIERETLLKYLKECATNELFDSDMARAVIGISVYVEMMPTADVQPVKRGKWHECYTDSHHYSGICSACGKASIKNLNEKPYDYCPRCGADMREKEGE